ncbi:MAG: hypothetical protein JWR42_228 [Marmoricola sp.]|nr:hypothetical protein [Marmoricola sp.]
MIGTDQAQTLLGNGGQVVDSDGNKIGKAGQVYLDDRTGEPAWVTVKTGLFGGAESFVPLAEGTADGDDVRVPYSKDQVKDAPRIEDADRHLSREEEAELYRYYGLTDPDHGHSHDGDHDHDHDGGTGTVGDAGTRSAYAESTGTDTRSDRDAGVADTGRASAGHDTSGPDTDNAMTRSEEQVRVGTETETVGRARLRKYVVTENVTKTVPVSHEEVRIEREPITDANVGDATSGGDITEEEHEVELKGERVVVDKEAVPVERVKMGTETVTEDQQVSEEVRKEQIDTDTDTDTADRGPTR